MLTLVMCPVTVKNPPTLTMCGDVGLWVSVSVSQTTSTFRKPLYISCRGEIGDHEPNTDVTTATCQC